MENRFAKYCFDSEVVGFHYECDRLNCRGNHAFTLYWQNNLYFYCLNRKQLGQYYRCIVEDCQWLCPGECKCCSVCKEMSEDFSELQRVYFFQPNVSGDKPLQPVMWLIFNRNIDKNNRQFKTEIAKSIPHIGIVTNYGHTC